MTTSWRFCITRNYLEFPSKMSFVNSKSKTETDARMRGFECASTFHIAAYALNVAAAFEKTAAFDRRPYAPGASPDGRAAELM